MLSLPTVFFFILSALAQDAVVDLGYSKYEGRVLSNGIVQWLGMRYAAPPVGDLRFAAPQDPESESEATVSTSSAINDGATLTIVRA